MKFNFVRRFLRKCQDINPFLFPVWIHISIKLALGELMNPRKFVYKEMGGGIAQWLAYFLLDPAALGSIPSIPSNIFIWL